MSFTVTALAHGWSESFFWKDLKAAALVSK